MKRIAIVGVGPTGIYTFYELVKRGEPLAITLFEKEAQAGVGMPYSDDNTAAQMLANIASIEIPPIDLTYLQWLQRRAGLNGTPCMSASFCRGLSSANTIATVFCTSLSGPGTSAL